MKTYKMMKPLKGCNHPQVTSRNTHRTFLQENTQPLKKKISFMTYIIHQNLTLVISFITSKESLLSGSLLNTHLKHLLNTGNVE